MMYVNPLGNLYQVDMRVGDREATPEEIAAWEEARKPTKEQRITARCVAAGYATKGHLFYAIENMRTVAALDLGITKEQAHAAGMAENQMYQQLMAAWNDVLTIEEEQ
jgi:hypothetical protein